MSVFCYKFLTVVHRYHDHLWLLHFIVECIIIEQCIIMGHYCSGRYINKMGTPPHLKISGIVMGVNVEGVLCLEMQHFRSLSR